MISFDIPYPSGKDAKGRSLKSAFNKRYGLNAYYAGKHYRARAKDASDLHALTLGCMKRERVQKRMFDKPVTVTFLWDDGLDIDNHAVLGKAIVDAMKGYLLQDDNRKHYVECVHKFWDGGCIRVMVREVSG